MDITKDALQFITDLAKTEIIEVNGQKYSTKVITHVKLPSPAAIKISTLTGLVDYIKSEIDGLINENLLIQICSPHEVKLFSRIKDDASRDCFIISEAQLPQIYFNTFVDVERFNIMLQSCFIKNEDCEAVLRVVGNITEENVRSVGDDGVSQTVTARAGIAKVANVPVPNPVILRPYRTFSEVEQPASKFVFRMQDGPKAGLFEADGGAWRSEAMQNIKKYLDIALVDTGVKIIS